MKKRSNANPNVGAQDDAVELDTVELDAVDTEAASDADTVEVETAAVEATAGVEVVRGEREFRVGGSVIKENESTAGLSSEQVRDALKSMYPEVANAAIRERVENGVSIVEFLPQPGRKG